MALAGLRAVFDTRLADDDAWRLLARFARLLPLAVGDHEFGFEVPLGTQVASVDFGFAMRPGGRLARDFESGCAVVPERHARAVAWYLVPYDIASAPVECLLFEYDLRPACHVPALFVVPFQAVSFDVPGVVVNLLALLRPAPTLVQRRWLGAVLGPDGSRAVPVSSVGFFPGRKIPVLRVNAPVFRLDDFEPVVRALGWTGDSDTVCEVLAALPGAFSFQVGIDLDGFGRVGDRLGVELHLPAPEGPWIGGGWPASTPALWEGVLDALCALGVCVPEKVGPLLGLHGRWDLALPTGSLPLAGGLNHLKLSFSGRSVFAKAYPAFSLRGDRGG